jgi:predicted CXXCH cytochrome family protein
VVRLISAVISCASLLTIAALAPAVPEQSGYVGSAACAQCHQKQSAAWQGSQHQRAMQPATAETVLAAFKGEQFKYAGVTSTFFRRGDKFVVKTDGPDGRLHDYEIAYTFGVEPLQQYLIELPGGRLQALSIAWDVGRKRWFHLYPKERITHTDELHWTRPAQNWNFMCADCHSTGVRKNYDAAAETFHSEWAEVSVGCEACHGPGAKHVAWANARGKDKNDALSVQFDERRGITWKTDAATGMPARSSPRDTSKEIQVCAQCHSLRSQLGEGYTAGNPFLDHYRPTLLTTPHYHVDGQQRGEVYDWGSFLQSKMNVRGVTCSDCHEPHSGKLRAAGNAVCTQCHAAAKYDAASHHHHQAGSAGAQCAACHMPTATYMVIDPRHDHSLRIPRPDLSIALGTPNACNGCHGERDAAWAAAQVKTWYGHDPQGYQSFGRAFAARDARAADARTRLRTIAGDTGQPPIVRASALAGLQPVTGRASREALARGVQDADGLVRLAALTALSAAPSELRLELAVPLLSDPLRSVRVEAASVLADVPPNLLSGDRRAAFDRAAAEYVAVQRYNADRADARVNLGAFYARRHDASQAEAELKTALELDPSSVPAYVNLADLYRELGREADTQRILRQGLKRNASSAVLHHALGLALVRSKRNAEALAELKRAAAQEPANARFAYVYAVALHSSGRAAEAIGVLTRAETRAPNDTDILQALASFYHERGEQVKAADYAERLRKLAAGDD